MIHGGCVGHYRYNNQHWPTECAYHSATVSKCDSQRLVVVTQRLSFSLQFSWVGVVQNWWWEEQRLGAAVVVEREDHQRRRLSIRISVSCTRSESSLNLTGRSYICIVIIWGSKALCENDWGERQSNGAYTT